MKLYGITTTYNCEDLIPYVMPYIHRLGYDKLLVYDDHSTDKTVELLSEYDFIEIREFSENKMSNLIEFENRKCDLILDLFADCGKEVNKTGELIAMTVTDFDEVIYSNFLTSFKEELEYSYRSDGYNCFATKMINLLPPTPNFDVKPYLNKKTLVHSLNEMRGCVWKVGGMKPLLFIVNDMQYYATSLGNHYALFSTYNNKLLKNYDEVGFIYAFHLKFINKTDFINRQKDYKNGQMMPFAIEEHALDIYDNSLFASSFPLKTYFCLKQLNSARSKIEGIYDSTTEQMI